jgi:MFS family permease
VYLYGALFMNSGGFWLKFGLFTVGLGQSFVFVLVPPLARDLGLSEVQTSTIFAISAVAWAMTSAGWGRASDRYGRRNIAILGLVGYAISMVALITPLFLVERNVLDVIYLFPLLILGRLINGIIGSATRPASFAYVADTSSREERTLEFARMESSFLAGTVMGPLIGGVLFLVTKETPFYLFSALALIGSIGIFFNLEQHEIKPRDAEISEISYSSYNVWPFLFLAGLTSLCQASLLQSIGFFVTDTFGSLDDLAILISVSFALISISAIVSQYLFTDLVALNNYKLLICGGLLMALSYYAMSYSDTIAIYYLTLIFNGFGVGMMRPATASSLSLNQLPENQGSAAGYLGSVMPIGHMMVPVIAMPIYAIQPNLLYVFSSGLCILIIFFIIVHPIFKENLID